MVARTVVHSDHGEEGTFCETSASVKAEVQSRLLPALLAAEHLQVLLRLWLVAQQEHRQRLWAPMAPVSQLGPA